MRILESGSGFRCNVARRVILRPIRCVGSSIEVMSQM